MTQRLSDSADIRRSERIRAPVLCGQRASGHCPDERFDSRACSRAIGDRQRPFFVRTASGEPGSADNLNGRRQHRTDPQE